MQTLLSIHKINVKNFQEFFEIHPEKEVTILLIETEEILFILVIK